MMISIPQSRFNSYFITIVSRVTERSKRKPGSQRPYYAIERLAAAGITFPEDAYNLPNAETIEGL